MIKSHPMQPWKVFNLEEFIEVEKVTVRWQVNAVRRIALLGRAWLIGL